MFLKYATISSELSVDTENDPETDLFLGLSCGFVANAMYFPVNHLEEDANISEEMVQEVLTVIREAPLRIFHNAAFDLQIFSKLGYPEFWELPFADTMIMAHMINENVLSKSLDYLHKYYTGKDGKNRSPIMQGMIDTMGWRYVPVVLMDEYAANDALITWELYETLIPMWEAQFGPLYYHDQT